MKTKPKHYFLVQKPTSHFSTVRQITALLKIQSHVLLNAVLLKSCWNISMTGAILYIHINIIHTHKHKVKPDSTGQRVLWTRH